MRKTGVSRRFSSRFGVSIGLLALASCGGAPASAPASNAAPGPVATGGAPAAARASALPRSVEALVDLVPGDAALVAHLPGPDVPLAGVGPAPREGLVASVVGGLVGDAEIGPRLASAILKALEGAAIFTGAEGSNARDHLRNACAAARLRDVAPVQRLLAAPSVQKTEDEQLVIEDREGDAVVFGALLPEARIVLLCADSKALSTSLGVAAKREASFRTSPRFKGERASDFWISLDLHRFGGRDTAGPQAGSRLFAALPAAPGAGVEAELFAQGRSFPPLGAVLAESSHATLGKLPNGAVAALGLSIRRSPGKTLGDVLDMLGRIFDAPGAAVAAEALGAIGVQLGDLDRALGGEVAIGIYRDPKQYPSFDGGASGGIEKHMAVLVTVATPDQAAQKKLFNALTAHAKQQPPQLTQVKADGSIWQIRGDRQLLRLEPRRGFLLLALGEREYLAEVVGQLGKEKESLAANPAFVEARSRAKPASHLLAYVDHRAFGDLVDRAFGSRVWASGQPPTTFSLTLGPSDRGLGMSLSSNGGIDLLGMAAGLALEGTRTYLASAKVEEAKNTVGAIFRAAAAAFERESGTPQQLQQNARPLYQLCKSANPVPARLARGTTYTPSSSPGQDFNRGDDATGWRCLRFSMEQPIYYQYDYRVGGGYKGPARGGPDPGKDGFEASAEGDLDGDGKTSLFTRTGKVVNGQLIMSTQFFVSDELE